MRCSVTASSPNASLKSGGYSGIAAIAFAASSALTRPISSWFSTGWRAWSSSELTRPSQKRRWFSAALSSVGALRATGFFEMPTARGRPSVNASAATWQVAHDTVPSAERRGSAKSFAPSATFAGVLGLVGGSSGRATPSGGLSPASATAPAAATPIQRSALAPADRHTPELLRELGGHDDAPVRARGGRLRVRVLLARVLARRGRRLRVAGVLRRGRRLAGRAHHAAVVEDHRAHLDPHVVARVRAAALHAGPVRPVGGDQLARLRLEPLVRAVLRRHFEAEHRAVARRTPRVGRRPWAVAHQHRRLGGDADARPQHVGARAERAVRPREREELVGVRVRLLRERLPGQHEELVLLAHAAAVVALLLLVADVEPRRLPRRRDEPQEPEPDDRGS